VQPLLVLPRPRLPPQSLPAIVRLPAMEGLTMTRLQYDFD
jgi:hypothetical protein